MNDGDNNNSDNVRDDELETHNLTLDRDGNRDESMPCNNESSDLKDEEEEPVTCDGFDDYENLDGIGGAIQVRNENTQSTRQDPTVSEASDNNASSETADSPIHDVKFNNGDTAYVVRTALLTTASSSSSVDSSDGFFSRSATPVQEQSNRIEDGRDNSAYSNLSMTPTAISQNPHVGGIIDIDHGTFGEHLGGRNGNERMSLSQPAPRNYQLIQGRQSKRGAGGRGGQDGEEGGEATAGNVPEGENQAQNPSQSPQRQSRPGAYNVSEIATGDIPSWAWTSNNHYYHQRQRRRHSSSSSPVDDDAMNAAIQESYQLQRESEKQAKIQQVWNRRIINFVLFLVVAVLVFAIAMGLKSKNQQPMYDDRSDPDFIDGDDFASANEDGSATMTKPNDDVPFFYYDDDVVEHRWTSIRETIEYFTHDPKSLDNPMSPQRKALDWLVHDDMAQIDTTDFERLATRYGLAVLYFATNGLQWYESYQFLSPLHECNWTSTYGNSTIPSMDDDHPYGVICNARYRVDSLILEGNGLFGEIPEDIFYSLLHLRHLRLRNNSLAGSLPSSMPIAGRLKTLDLSENFFSSTIPSNIGQLEFLGVLRLGSNALYGTVPDFYLFELMDLNLTKNALTGPIFTLDDTESFATVRWGQLRYLEVLDISHNGFTGTIAPSIFTGLRSIKTLDIGHNSFTGSLPIEAAEALKSINSLKANGNQLTGSFPWSLFSHFNLVHIEMSDNLLTDGLPINTGRFTYTLEHFDFSNNRIQSTIPGALGELTNLKQLILNDNQIFGSLPDSISNMEALEILDMSRNNIDGSLLPSLANCQKLVELYLHGNQFAGSFPSTFSQLSSLRHATFHDNEIAGDIEFMCSSGSAATSTTRSMTNVTNVEGDFIRLISADCSGDHPKVVCTSCCECHDSS